MATRVGINGFGRIGRLVFRAAIGNPSVEIVALNDLTDTHTLAHLLKYDSVHGTLTNDVKATKDGIAVDGREIKVWCSRDPKTIAWGSAGADVVVESTGHFTKRAGAAGHLEGGAKKVIISAPSGDADVTVCVGVNEKDYDPAKHQVISNASCTTNCLAPVAMVLDQQFGVVHGLMTTIHSYTNDQRILDFIHEDLRRARAAALSMIPTKTGAASAIGLVLPSLKGKLDGLAVRVPTPNVSLVDLTVTLKKKTTTDELNAALKKASEQPGLKGVLGYSDEPLVSVDYNHCSYSSVVDALSTKVIDGDFAKVLAWYDNEWGFSNRVVDLAKLLGAKL